MSRAGRRVEVPLNDSLTSFRIVAVADGEADLFGTGQTAIRSTQELMLFSGLPPLVREQDSYRAAFTVRNASEGRSRSRCARASSAETGGERAAARRPETDRAQPRARACRRKSAGT